MSKALREQIWQTRKYLGNPYALIEQVEEADEAVLRAAISQARKDLENPYAYLTGDSQYEGEVTNLGLATSVDEHKFLATQQAAKTVRWSNRQIETKVRSLQTYLWTNRNSIWQDQVPSNPIEILDPVIALQVLGYDVGFEDGLGTMPGQGDQIEVAGIIETNKKIVRIGRQFKTAVQTFTVAHELGHAVLHPNLGALHRDKPLDGALPATDRVESEANKFATLFLMPAKLVRSEFFKRFQSERFEFTEETAFALGIAASDIQGSDLARRQKSQILAETSRYNGHHFIPLHEEFGVSRAAMAIRLEELEIM